MPFVDAGTREDLDVDGPCNVVDVAAAAAAAVVVVVVVCVIAARVVEVDSDCKLWCTPCRAWELSMGETGYSGGGLLTADCFVPTKANKFCCLSF